MSEANEVPISKSCMGCLVDIQTALKPLKKSEKIELKCITILGLSESFKMMNQSDPTRPDPTVMLFDSLFLVKYNS